MTETPIRGIVQNGAVLVPHLPEGTEVIVTPAAFPRGSGKAIVEALRNAPPIDPAWVDEMEAHINAGRSPPSPAPDFGNDEE